MSDCPSTSLVKMKSERVSELAYKTIIWLQAQRAKELYPFEAQIAERMERRLTGWRKAIGLNPSRSAAVASFDFVWHIMFTTAQMTGVDEERVAKRLLLATKESADGFIWVSVADLAVIS